MDAPECDPVALSEALAGVAGAGRWLGAERRLRRAVAGLLEGRSPGRVRVLDVGTGNAAGALRLLGWMREEGWRPRLVALDLHAGALRAARDRVENGASREEPTGTDVRFLRADAAALPLPEGSVELIVSSTTLHHLEREAAVRCLAEMERVAHWGWALTDLSRSRAAYAGARLLAATLWRSNPMNRADGPASVRRAFTPSEVGALAAEAGIRGARVRGGAFGIVVSRRTGGSRPECGR